MRRSPDSHAHLLLEDVVDKGRLSCPEESGDDRHGSQGLGGVSRHGGLGGGLVFVCVGIGGMGGIGGTGS